MHIARLRSALAFSLLVVLLGLSAGCANLPGFLKRGLAASPSPAATEAPADDSEAGTPQDIEGQVGNATAAPTVPPTATP